MARKISFSLEEDLLNQIDAISTQRNQTRQEVLVDILSEYTANHREAIADLPITISNELKDHLESEIARYPLNKEVNLKQLVGDKRWCDMETIPKRKLGKIFKSMVEKREFEHLTVGRKKSNNEQQYTVI